MELLQALSDTGVAATLRGSAVLFAIVNAAHILAIGLIVGSLATLDLRLLGALSAAPLRVLGPPLSRMAAAGVLLAVVTGVLMFSTQPRAYAQNPAFLIKVSLVALGVVNALALHRGRHWHAALAGDAPGTPVRIAAFLSLAIWISAVMAGRWIGFSM